MLRTIAGALAAGVLALMVGAVLVTIEPVPALAQTGTKQSSMPYTMRQTVQTGPKAQAVKHAQAALDAANAGRTSSMVQEAQQALSEAKQAQRTMPNADLKTAVQKLQLAVNKAKAGDTMAAKQALQTALNHLRAG